MATTLYSQATPMPIAIRVNMFRRRVRTEAQPRTKNGQPAHSTTGVARTSWIQLLVVAGIASAIESTKCVPITSRTIGTVSTAPIQNRRVMSTSSAFGPASEVTTSGSRAIPQIGQEPGLSRRISGCIGHVYSTTSPFWAVIVA